MRAPIGLRISSRRRALGVSQAALARRAGISASYLNLIERNKRHVGGSLLIRLADELDVELSELSGDSEHRLIAELDEAFADPVLAAVDMPASRDLVAQQPAAAQAIARLRRAYLGATANADLYADRLRSDPLLAQLLTVVQAGQLRLDGKPAEAIRLLRPLLRGDELFQVHSALRAAYAAAGQDEDALAEARWLAQHRGRAYIETGGSQVLQTLNVADTTLALREQARSLARLGQDAEAQRQDEAFRRAWPQSGSSPPVPPMPLARASAPSSPVSKQ